jgi:hypothetical protein
MTSAMARFFLEGFRLDGLCLRYRHEADELIHVARTLRADLEQFKRAPDPFGALVSTVYNNSQFEKTFIPDVDTGTKPGVQASPIKTALRVTR